MVLKLRSLVEVDTGRVPKMVSNMLSCGQMSAWKAQSASMVLEGTVLTSSFFQLFTRRCISGTTAALGLISS